MTVRTYSVEVVEGLYRRIEELESLKQAAIEQLVDENIAIETVAKDRYCTMQTRIEELEGRVKMLDAIITGVNTALKTAADRIEQLEGVVEAAKGVLPIDLFLEVDATHMERLEQAIAALEKDNES